MSVFVSDVGGSFQEIRLLDGILVFVQGFSMCRCSSLKGSGKQQDWVVGVEKGLGHTNKHKKRGAELQSQTEIPQR